MKKVIFLMIDSFMPRVLQKCIDQGLVPALEFLKKKGMFWEECTTVFPTMTATVDCSLITGEYPELHEIPALIWYDPEEHRLVNYTNGALPVLRLGLATCAHDVICNLNDKHLSKEVRTIYEELAGIGRTSASINLIAHRSYHNYQVKLPFLLQLATKFRSFEDITGPEVFSLGCIARSTVNPPIPWKWDESLFGHYGINDAYAIRFLNHLISHSLLPDFTMVYLPDNDHQVHVNPRKACKILSKVDKKLQKMLNQFPSWEEALEQCVFIITGDHGQTLIGNTQEHNIHLENLLVGMKITGYAERGKPADDLIIANNERMTYIYPLKPGVEQEVVSRLAEDMRIDLIGWKEEGWVNVRSGMIKGNCRFTPNGNLSDIYGRKWEFEGEPKLMDLEISDGRILFGDYPDVLSRLYGALFSQEIPIIACTAKPGYEFKSSYAPTHLRGGSHGSLHKIDSTIPLIISGADKEQPPFEFPRLIDLKGYILRLLS